MSSAKKINAFSVFIFFIFLASLCYVGIFLVNTSSARAISVPQKAKTLADSLQTLTEKESIDSYEYYQGITSLISSDSTISAFVLSQDGNPSYVWPVGSSIVLSDDDNNPYLSSSSPLISIQDGYFITESGVTKYSVAYSNLTSQDIYSRLIQVFIIIATATVICLLVIAYISVFCTPRSVPEKSECIEQQKDYSEYESEDDYETEYPYSVSFNDDINEVLEEQDNETCIRKVLPENEVPESFVVEAAQRQASVHAAPKKRVLKETEDPLGLFSDLTGFGWESYLETRLDSELIRAASSEYDLALFIIRIKDVERTHPAYNEICSVLLSFFKYRDMVFEYGSDGFAGILTGMDINGCMASVEKLYMSLSETLEKNGINGKISIGISTRSFRLIPGDRLLHEAKDAVVKADEEKDMPVVAFRVNPNKYKQFLDDEMIQSEPIAS